MRFSAASFVLLVALVAPSLPAQQLMNPMPPNFMLPDSMGIPTTKLSKWKAGDGRTTLTLQSDKATLRGYRYAGADPGAPTILFFNGSGNTIEGNDKLYRMIAAEGPSVDAFDYRGWGFSTGYQDMLAFRQDALALYDQMLAQEPTHKIIVYGYSMGTAFASYVASQRPVAGLVLAAPMSSAIELVDTMATQMGASPSTVMVLRVEPDTAALLGEAVMVKHSTAPLLLIHGTSDQTIPFSEGREVFDASPSVKKYFVKIQGADHDGLPLQPGALQSVKLFLPVVEKP